MSTSELVDRALDGILRRGLGNGPVRAERNLEVGDVASANVVDETVNVNRFEGARVRIAAGGSAGAVLALFLSDVSIPVLLHRRADEDVEHRVLDVLFDQSAESRVIELGRVDVRLVPVCFAERYDLRAARVQVSVTNRVNPTLNRTTCGVACRIWSRQHRGLDTATPVVAHYDDVSNAQRLDAIRQDADRVVIGGLELVRNVPLGKERARRRRENCSLRDPRITASQEQVLRVLSVRREILQQVWIRGIRNRRTEILVALRKVHQIREPRGGIIQIHDVLRSC